MRTWFAAGALMTVKTFDDPELIKLVAMTMNLVTCNDGRLWICLLRALPFLVTREASIPSDAMDEARVARL
jgi:hypothetical protein